MAHQFIYDFGLLVIYIIKDFVVFDLLSACLFVMAFVFVAGLVTDLIKLFF